MIAAIIACEVGFWVLLVSGLAARYMLRARRLSTALLLAVPLVDVLLLAISVVDLRRGGVASAAHGLAAVYIGASLAFGHQMIGWADQRFAHRFAGGPVPLRPPRSGRAHAAYQRRQWLRHLLAYVVAAAVLGLFTALVGDLSRAAPLWAVMAPWGIGVVVDFVVSFSYTLAPRRPPATAEVQPGGRREPGDRGAGEIRPGGRREPGGDRPAHRGDAGYPAQRASRRDLDFPRHPGLHLVDEAAH